MCVVLRGDSRGLGCLGGGGFELLIARWVEIGRGLGDRGLISGLKLAEMLAGDGAFPMCSVGRVRVVCRCGFWRVLGMRR